MKKRNIKKVIVGIIFCLIISSIKVTPVNAKSSNMQSFEKGVPSNWTTEKGTLEISTKRYKDKDHSLLWKWKGNDKLTVTSEKNMLEAGKSRNGGIILWLYNEDPRNDTLTFNFGTTEQINNNNPLYTFDFYLNFTGWRTIWVDFKDDAVNEAFVGKREGNLEQMQIVAPKTEGSIYFDVLEFQNSMYWNRVQDYQVPLQRSDDEKGDVWQRNYYHINKKPYLPLEPITNEHIDTFKIIENRVNDWIYGGSKYTNTKEMLTRKRSLDKFIKAGVEKYDSFNIKRHPDGRITGKPLFGNRSPYVTNQNGFGSGLADTVFLPLVYDYKLNGNNDSLQKLYDLYDYYHDQGWAEGSGLGSWNLGILRTTGYFISVYLMKDELKQTNRLDREMGAFNWYSDFGKIFIDPEKEKESSNSDDLRTNSLNRLLYILMMEDSPEKVQAMKSYVNWFNNTLNVGNYLSGTIKPDYMGFHHQAPYMSAYAPDAYHLTSAIVYLLHDTTFKISDEVHNNLKQALITHDILTNQTEIPIALRGRIVQSSPISIKLLPAYAYLAMAGNPETNGSIDIEMAGIFMKNWQLDSSILQRDLLKQSGVGISYVNTLGAISVMLDVVNSGVGASPEQQGFWSKPYGGLAVKRKDDWMATVKGWSKYLWDYESSSTENIYGRYLSYGTLQIMSKGPLITDKNNGYDFENGWDWNRMPGATTKHLSLNDLSSKNNNNEHRTYSDEIFLGSVEGKDDNGVWAMSMHDLTFDNSFYAKKSVFFLGDEMILLGSDIKNKDTKNKTETTLFQSSIYDNTNKPIHIGSIGEVTQFPYKNKLGNGANWVIDSYDNGYYIPNASNVHITREQQTSRNSSDKADTTGNYATAWIDHGSAPDNGEYEYVIKVKTTPEEMANYASNINYEVAQKDNVAHIVKSKDTGVFGYAIFKENQKLSNQEYIVETDTPILAMVTPTGNDISLSISDPDLRVSTSDYMSPSTMKKTKVTLKGKWSLKNKSDDITILSANEDHTVIEVNCIDGKTIDVELQKQNENIMHSVTVINGTGTGEYKAGDIVTIEANEEEDNKNFVEWTSPDGVKFQNPTEKVTSFIMPEKDVTIIANYDSYYTITAIANKGGKITPGTVKVEEGKSQTYKITADKGYEIADVLVNGKSVGIVREYTFKNVSNDATIEVHFKKKEEKPSKIYYTITATAYEGGKITTPGTVIVEEGKSYKYEITPEEGYEISDVFVNGKSVGIVSEYTFKNMSGNGIIQAYFKKKGEKPSKIYYTITATAYEGGKITTPGTVAVEEGKSYKYEITPEEGYEISDVFVNGKSIGIVSEYTFENMSGNGIIQAYFKKKGEKPSKIYYTITATAYEGGKITTPGTVAVEEGKSYKYEITPEEGYEISDVLVNGKSIGIVSEYTFKNMSGNGIIQAYFKKKGEKPSKIYYTTTAISNEEGKITSGILKAEEGKSQTEDNFNEKQEESIEKDTSEEIEKNNPIIYINIIITIIGVILILLLIIFKIKKVTKE